MPTTIVLLVGTSSAGKSTLAKELQAILRKPKQYITKAPCSALFPRYLME
jgi:uridine kinase